MPALLAPKRAVEAPVPSPVVLIGELTDSQWAAIAPLLPPGKSTGRRRSTDLRRVVTAINHHWRTGCPWRKLPSGFPPWPTVYTYFRRWLKDGTLRQLRSILNPPKLSEVVAPSRRAGRLPVRLDPDRGPFAARTAPGTLGLR